MSQQAGNITYQRYLTHSSLVVALCTTKFSAQKFYILTTQWIWVFCMDLRTSSDYFPKQHELNGLYNRDGKRLLRGTTWTFKHNSGHLPSLKAWQLTHHTQCTSNQLTHFCIPAVNFLLFSEHPVSSRLFGSTFHSQIKTFLSSRLLFCELALTPLEFTRVQLRFQAVSSGKHAQNRHSLHGTILALW
jgi:hypothetical protein